jgi:hypothetical protein
MEDTTASRRRPSPIPTGRRSPAAIFRREIEAAEAEGVDRADMKLSLTLSDLSLLKRDPTLAVSDISFAGGVMRFLQVEVAQGGATESKLERG